MHIIKLILLIFIFLLLPSGGVIKAQEEITTEHYLEIYLSSTKDTEVNHKIKITNNNKYNGVKSLDFSEINENFEFIKNFNTEEFEISNIDNKPKILLSTPLIGPKSVEIGYKYITDKLFYKNGLNYTLKLVKLNDPYMNTFVLKIFLPSEVAKDIPLNLTTFVKKNDKGATFIELNDESIKKLGSEITFGKNATYLLSLKHLISNEKPYIIIPANLDNRQITSVLSLSKKPSRVYKKNLNVYLEYENVKKPEFIEAKYLVELYSNKIQANNVEQIGTNLTSSQKYWDFSSKNIKTEINQIKMNANIKEYAKKAYVNTLSKLSYNDSSESFSFINRIGAENINSTNAKKAYCLDYTDYLIASLRGLKIESGEIDGFFYQSDIDSYNVAKLHSWVIYKDSSNTYKEVDPTFEDTSGNNYFDNFDLSHIILAIKIQNPETPYVFGTYTKGNMYESLKIKALSANDIANITFSNIDYSDLYIVKILTNTSGKVLKNILPFETKIISNESFESLKKENKNIVFEQKNIFFFLPKNVFIYFFPLIPLIMFFGYKLYSYIKKKRNKGKRVKSVL